MHRNNLNANNYHKCERLPVEENINIDEFCQVVILEIERELWDKNVTAFFSHMRLSEKEKIGLQCNMKNMLRLWVMCKTHMKK